MLLKFTKMQGIGNDFVVIDALTSHIRLTPTTIARLADRHFGIGCDQVLVVDVPDDPNIDFCYRIYNHNGSEVGQCGNGARCIAKYVHDRKLTASNPVRLSTLSGRYEIHVNEDHSYSVNMGVPVFHPPEVPFLAGQQADRYSLQADGEEVSVSVLSLGNPHAVLEVEDTQRAPVERLGASLEQHPDFPNRANIGFMQVISREEINLRVYERGTGETLACGSGACAAVVAGIRLGLLDDSVQVHLPGGLLKIHWPGEGQSVILSGPAKTVFHGQVRL